MSRLLVYLKTEGPLPTVHKVFNAFLIKIGIRKSSTLFFVCHSNHVKVESKRNDLSVKVLDASDLHDFEIIKFFNHMHGEDYVNNPDRRIILIWQQNHIIAYAAAQRNVKHRIHGLGYFLLGESECWIGPTYVTKANRNRGIASYMIRYIQNHVFPPEMIQTYYTSINKTNASSISSFVKSGFELLGSIIVYRHKVSKIIDSDNIINEHFSFKI